MIIVIILRHPLEPQRCIVLTAARKALEPSTLFVTNSVCNVQTELRDVKDALSTIVGNTHIMVLTHLIVVAIPLIRLIPQILLILHNSSSLKHRDC